MRHITTLDEISLADSWLTIGVFDGVHLGHQAIIRRLVAGARRAGVPAVVLTFHPHPEAVLKGLTQPFYLTLPEERAALLGSLGVEVVVTQPFTRELASQPGEAFLRRLKEHLGFSHLWVGYDFAMGRARDMDTARLHALQTKYAYRLEVLRPVIINGETISSSKIRAWLRLGEVERANRGLGRPYTLKGEVVAGDARGRQIGVPTANVRPPAERLVPARGVYACRVRVGETLYRAATNIGIRPTFDGDSSPPQTVEAHILDFDGDLYGEEIEVQFLRRLRDERRFAGIQDLLGQIHQDIQLVREVVSL
ncbi:MAG TPA: bifunctional riboflavin kinase/FAD synthetase [Chloroflexi bacterium]|nr:bifunctional riboflavin kinase/FAD synthetase [Chloroflexota bacterium]